MTTRNAVTLLAILTLVALPSSAELHGSLAELEPLLGSWLAAEDPELRIEYRPALGGRFIESWRFIGVDPASAALVAHSMIGADIETDRITEHRFDTDGQLTVLPFSTDSSRLNPIDDSERSFVPLGSIAPLDASLLSLEPFLGRWEITTDWLDGGLLWAMMSNSSELAGRVICSKVWAAEGGKDPYDRYRSFFLRSGDGALREITFTYSGRVSEAELRVESGPKGLAMTVAYAPGSMSDVAIVKRLAFPSDLRMQWTDRFLPEGATEWVEAIDASWSRIGSPDPWRPARAIDDEPFVAAGSNVSSFTLDRLMEGSAEEVWTSWTTAAGWKAAYGPDRPEIRADIALAIGGKYEWFFDGEIGGNGNQVLSYIPGRMLSFSWNSPVAQTKSRTSRTWVVVELRPESERRTLVSLTHLGFGSEPHWQKTKAYFESAWAYVLDQMAKNVAHRG